MVVLQPKTNPTLTINRNNFYIFYMFYITIGIILLSSYHTTEVIN